MIKSAIYSIFALIFLLMINLNSNAQSQIELRNGNKVMTATLADNDAARELATLLDKGVITVEMEDYGGFEKVGELPQALPASNSQITTVPGDIMLYLGRNIVIFYGSNSWSYTPLGKIDGATPDNVKEFLGKGPINLVISLQKSSGIDEAELYLSERDNVFDLSGNPVRERPLSPGVYVINGVKKIIKH